MRTSRRFKSVSLSEPCFTISETDPWCEENEVHEDGAIDFCRSSSSLSSLSYLNSAWLSRDDNVHRNLATQEDGGPLMMATPIVPQFCEQKTKKGSSVAGKMLSGLKYAADFATSSAGRRRHARSSTHPPNIHARGSVAQPQVEERPTCKYAWEGPGERPTGRETKPRFSNNSRGSKASSSSLGSTPSAQDWVNGW